MFCTSLKDLDKAILHTSAVKHGPDTYNNMHFFLLKLLSRYLMSRNPNLLYFAFHICA